MSWEVHQPHSTSLCTYPQIRQLVIFGLNILYITNMLFFVSINFNCVNNTDSLSLLLLANVCIGRINFNKTSYNGIFLKQILLKYGTDF